MRRAATSNPACTRIFTVILSPRSSENDVQGRLAPAPSGKLSGRSLGKAARKALATGRLPPGVMVDALPRLRFDRVAQRVVRDLQAKLSGAVPKNAALIVTVTAPIRLPAKTVAELGRQLAGPFARDFDKVICGNRVRARMVSRCVPGAPKVVVFVHNPEPAPHGLFRLAEDLLSAASHRPGSRSTR